MTIRSVIPRTPCWRTSSAISNASLKVVSELARRNRFWFGMTISVSTCCWSSAMPASAERPRREPSNANGLVTTPTVRMPLSRAALAMTGAAPVPVPPPMPAAMKHMCAPSSAWLISSIVSSAAARPISGREPAPRPCVILRPSWMRRSAIGCVERLGIGIRDDEIDALHVCAHHVGDGVAACTADADDADPRTKLVDLRPDEIDAHLKSSPKQQRVEPTG